MADGGTRLRGPVDGAALDGHLVDRRYLVGERIARGGMATVYRATDTRLDRVVALKVMHSSLGDEPDFVMRFVREARSAARLSHPNVVAVHDQGQDADLGLVYLVMEHLPGHTLRDVVREEAPLPPARALALLEPMLAALAAAHRAGIVHRDVKPENVLIADGSGGGERVKVADFGLAKAVSAETQHTATGGILIGTVSYLAPELLTEGRSDTRADVYAAGVVLHELLTGVKPHRGESPIQIAYHHVHTDVPLPSAQVPGLPAYVDALVARACVRDVGQRPADAGVLLHHVHRVAHALAHGVVEDPELVADLRPAPSPEPADAAAPSRVDVVGQAADADSGTWLFGAEPPVALPHPGPVTAPPVGRPTGAPTGTPTGAPARGRRGRGPWLVVALVLALVATAGGAYWLGVGRYTQVPGVLALSAAEATERIDTAGLEAQVTEDYSEDVAEGEVMQVEPAAGERILPGEPVSLTVSLGPERYDVPRVRGGSEDEGQDALLDVGFEVGDAVERYDARLDAGTVLGTDPVAGTSLPPGTEVSLVVSLGPRPVTVEDVTGDDADDVTGTYEDLGLVVVRTEESSDDVPEGDVIAQDPGPGDLLPGETLTLTVSSGPEDVEIPAGIVGSTVTDAREQLEDLGLVVVEDDDDSVGLGFVLEVDPGEGETVERGSEVTLSVF